METLYEKVFNVGKNLYRIAITKDYQIVLEKAGYDKFSNEYYYSSFYEKSDNPFYGMLVYKVALKEILKIVYTKRILYLYYTTGHEKRREKLYKFFSTLAEKYGYHCIYSDDCYFQFIKA